MPKIPEPQEDENGDVMAGDRRLSRPDSALPDWHIPDATYRPVPIVWFAGALLFQIIALTVLFFTLHSKDGMFTIAGSVIASIGILVWTWNRGMASASHAWKITTCISMFLVLLLYCASASVRL